MRDRHINTFGGGMNMDMGKSIMPTDVYPYALNMRLVSDSDNESLELQNILGNSYVTEYPMLTSIWKLEYNSDRFWNRKPFVTVIRNGVSTKIPFTLTGTTPQDYYQAIYKALLPHGAILGYNNNQLMVTFVGYQTFTISCSDPNIVCTQIVGRSDVVRTIGYCKIWSELYLFTTMGVGDGEIWKFYQDTLTLIYYNNLNLSMDYPVKAIGFYNNATNKRIYFTDNNNNLRTCNVGDAHLMVLDPSSFEIINSVDLTIPKPISIVSGNYDCGVVQYAYCLNKKNGQQTKFSNPSFLVNLSDKVLTTTTSSNYGGGDVDTNSGKGIRIQINNIDTRFDTITTVAIFYRTMTDVPTINIIDERTIPISGTVTFDDAGSSSLGTYTLDEYNTIGGFIFKCKDIEQKNNILIAANITEEYLDLDSYDTRAYRWNLAGDVMAVVDNNLNVTLHNNYSVDDTDDAIQTKDMQDTITGGYCYNRTTHVLGGSGPNISYEIHYLDVPIDTSTQVYNMYTTQVNQTWSTYFGSTFSDNVGFAGNQSPMNRQIVGYQRDEVYAFAMIAEDEYGRQSFPKWIADIKMPGLHETFGAIDYRLTHNISGINYARIIYPRFFIHNYPTDSNGNPYKIRIVRCKRQDKDKSIVCQGLILQTYSDQGYYPYPIAEAMTSTYSSRLYFISPEPIFYKKQNKDNPIAAGDYFRYVSRYTINTSNPSENQFVFKAYFSDVTLIPQVRRNISAVSLVDPDNSINIAGSLFYNTHMPDVAISRSGTKVAMIVDGFTGNAPGTWIHVGNVERILSDQYGGRGYYERIGRSYINCYQGLGNDGYIHVFGGDTYVDYFDYLNLYLNTSESWTLKNFRFDNIMFPVETTIPLAYRTDNPWHTGIGGTYWLQEEAGSYSGTDDSGTNYSYIQTKDLYLINPVYMREDDIKVYYPKPLNFDNIKRYETRLISSEKKILNEDIDSWCQFKVQNFIDLSSKYGPVNAIVNYNNRFLAFQDSAYGLTSIEERSLINDNNESELVLGTGGVLVRHDYVSTSIGCKHMWSIKATNSNLYFFDTLNRGLYSLGQEHAESDIKGFRSEIVASQLFNLSENPHDGGINCYYDKLYREIVYTFGTDTYSIYDVKSILQSKYSFYSPQYIEDDLEVYSILRQDFYNDFIYKHNTGTYGNFYSNQYDSRIRLLINKNFSATKVYDACEMYVDMKQGDISQLYEFWTTLKAWNDYQYTAELSFVHRTSLSQVIGAWEWAYERRDRTFSFFIPRNAVSVPASNNLNIFTNVDVTRQFRERMKDKYMFLELKYDGTKRINLPYSITNIRYTE